jgi:hypothetical protein
MNKSKLNILSVVLTIVGGAASIVGAIVDKKQRDLEIAEAVENYKNEHQD